MESESAQPNESTAPQLDSTANVPTQNIQFISPVSPKNSHDPNKISKIKYFASAFTSILLIFSLSFLYFFKWVPDSQAKEYLEQTGQDFADIQNSLKNSSEIFSQVSDSLALSKEAFSEISTLRKFSDAAEDTKSDMEDISNTLTILEEAKQTRANLKVPKQLEEFDAKLLDYYENVGKGMQLLLEHEQFQQKLQQASGDEVYTELDKLFTEYTKPHPTVEVHAYLLNLSRLAKESADRMATVKVIPPGNEATTQLLIEYHRDLQNTAANMASELLTGRNQRTFDQYLFDHFERNRQRNSTIKTEAIKYVQESPIKGHLDLSEKLQEELVSQFNELKEIYGLDEINLNQVPQESSESAQPVATSSAEAASPSPESTQSAN